MYSWRASRLTVVAGCVAAGVVVAAAIATFVMQATSNWPW